MAAILDGTGCGQKPEQKDRNFTWLTLPCHNQRHYFSES